LSQIAVVIRMAEPRLSALAAAQHDILLMRERFSIVQQARERVAELAQQADDCLGDSLATIGPDKYNQETDPDTNNVYDPTRPPTPGREVDRPGEASPYR
jgi:hypothetical protein